MHGTVLIVDDDVDTTALLTDALRGRGLSVGAVCNAHACLERVRSEAIDVVVTDVQMPGMNGVELCGVLHERHPDVLPIVLTGFGDLETAVAAIRAGAYDFIVKPATAEVLEVAIRRALEHLSVKREIKRLQSSADRNEPIPGLIGGSSAIREMSILVRKIAASDATALITGESGSGKELVARALHALSPRGSAPFVAVNCAAMPAPLLESELFGHLRGAFTDARTSRAGLFVQAGKGTILLDEIGEMPVEMQVKLLRVLQEKTVRPVGGDEEVPFAARVVAATNRDLEVAVEEKRFREDLYYRLSVVTIEVPPLRARSGDVLELANHMLAKIATHSGKPMVEITREAAHKLVDYDWPGNVRELENCVEHAVAVCNGKEIALANLSTKIREYQSARIEIATDNLTELISLDEMERRYVLQVLNAVAGNKTHAARILGIDRRSLYRRLEVSAATAQ